MYKLKFPALLILLLILSNCNSVKKYNETVNAKHSVKDLRKDIDFTFKKIKKLHPNLYWFISEEELNTKIDSVKNSITEPMTSKEFFFLLSPLVSEIRQGHNAVGYPIDRMEKDELEKYKKTKNDFNTLKFERIEDKIIISEIYDSVKTLLHAELIKIDTFEVEELINKYNYLRSSDGFNTSFYERREGLFLPSYYRIENPRLDSVKLTLSLNDSIFDTTFYRVEDTSGKKSKKEKITDNKIREEAEKPDDKITRIKNEAKEKKRKLLRGYNERTKQFNRDYNFLADSTVGYLKIRGFMNGPYKGLYEEFFTEVNNVKPETVIIDLRDNLGGRLAEIHELLGYFVTEEYTTIREMESKTRTPRTNAMWSTNNKPLVVLVKLIATPIIYSFEHVTSTKRNGIFFHEMKASKSSAPHGLAFEGKVYVIINGNSFSASSIISTNLQGSGRATIVGEETGGTYNGTVAGVFKPIKLPNSKVMVQFGLGMISAPYQENPDGFGVIPDYTVLPTLEHRKKGIDTELEWILKKVEEDKKENADKKTLENSAPEIMENPAGKEDKEDVK
jgi:C-terminal processing protease CtpA/Prc